MVTDVSDAISSAILQCERNVTHHHIMLITF